MRRTVIPRPRLVRGGPARLAVALLAAVALTAACSSDDDGGGSAGETTTTAADETTTTTALANPYPDYRSVEYANGERWLCGPDDSRDVCATDLAVTVVEPTGPGAVEPFAPAAEPAIDCFYVYPTISNDPTPNADFEPSSEIGVTQSQAARFGEVCRVFAPIYRQVSLSGLFPPAGAPPADREIGYRDVVDAWKHYVANHSDGRGVVLIGHSQGSGVLNRLIREEIDPNPDVRARLVSALLIGSAVRVPPGADVGGDFQSVPLCRATDQTGCVVSYATYRDTSPPPPDALFGRPRTGEGVAACVNPAAPAGGPAELRPIMSSDTAFGGPLPGVTTPYLTLPGMLRGECVERDGFSYLELTVQGDPADARPDDISGDLTAPWGMHAVDIPIAQGDLVALVAAQAEAYTAG